MLERRKEKAGRLQPQERLTVENINCYDDVDAEMLRRIGNMDTVQQKFQAVVDGKDETLSEIARSFLPDAEGKLQTASQECGQLRERAGTETKVSPHWVKDSK